MEVPFSVYHASQDSSIFQEQVNQFDAMQTAFRNLKLQNQCLHDKNQYLHSMLCTKEEQLNNSSLTVKELSETVTELYASIKTLSDRVNQLTKVEQEKIEEGEKKKALQAQYELAVEQRQAACIEATKWRLKSQEDTKLLNFYRKKFEELERQCEGITQKTFAKVNQLPGTSPSSSPLPSPKSSMLPLPTIHCVATTPVPVYVPHYICHPYYNPPVGPYLAGIQIPLIYAAGAPVAQSQMRYMHPDRINPTEQTHNIHLSKALHPRKLAALNQQVLSKTTNQ